MTQHRNNISFLDIHCAAFLELNGYPAKLENKNGRVIFVFPQTDEVYKLANAYNSNDLVHVADYISVLRTLKAKMYSLRDDQTARPGMTVWQEIIRTQ